MASVTVGFSIPEQDLEQLDHLVEHFAGGNRSAFLRMAMRRMETIERAQRLRDLQTFGVEQRSAAGLDDASVEEVVHRVLAKQRVG